jgi:tryptophanyl-tRNA synthetase
MTKPNLLSGMQPSASSLHLGNYLGALTQWVSMQQTHNAHYVIVDLHAITVAQDPKILAENTRKTAAQYIAAGLDVEQATLFVQSHVPAHSELAWILNCTASFGEASRMTQFKDKSQKGGSDNASVGLFTYPILQAADILLYQPKAVPVGEDQRQHLELTRNIAERFNNRYGKVFEIPEAVILKETAKIYDLQNPTAKMSKSATEPKGTVNLLDEDSVIAKKIKSAVTDTDGEIRFDPENKPGVSNLLGIFSAVSNRSVDDIVGEYSGSGYGQLKQAVADAVIASVTPIREKTNELMANPEQLDELLYLGAEKARETAGKTLRSVQNSLGFIPYRNN